MIHATGSCIFVLKLFVSETIVALANGRGSSAQQDGTILEGDVVAVVGALLIAQLHVEGDGDLVALLPVAGDGGEAGLAWSDDTVVTYRTVDIDAVVLAGPLGMADGEGVVAVLADGELGGAAVGEGRFLGDDKVVTFETGGDEEVDIEGAGAIVGVDEVAIL